MTELTPEIIEHELVLHWKQVLTKAGIRDFDEWPDFDSREGVVSQLSNFLGEDCPDDIRELQQTAILCAFEMITSTHELVVSPHSKLAAVLYAAYRAGVENGIELCQDARDFRE